MRIANVAFLCALALSAGGACVIGCSDDANNLTGSVDPNNADELRRQRCGHGKQPDCDAGTMTDDAAADAGMDVTTADTTAPTFGGATSASAASMSQINLAWKAATDNVTASSGIVYLVYMASTAGGENFASPSFTTAAGATSFNVTGLAASTPYYFVVRAKDAAGNIDTNTKEVTATTPAAPDTTAPTFTGATSATASSSTQISLAWSAASDNVTAASGIVYLVYGATASKGQNFTTPSFTTAAGATSFNVTGLSPSTAYYYVVRAKDAAGNIDTNTKEVTATTPAAPVTLSGNVQPILTAHCALSGCHSGAIAPNLAAGSTYASTVNVNALFCSTAKYVVPGSPSTSWLVAKVTAGGSVGTCSGGSMAGFLQSSADLNTISTWISQGANNN